MEMSRIARVLQSGRCEVTQEYKGASHAGIDIVKEGYQLDNIVSHSDGTVVQVINSCKYNTPNDGNNPGNMVKIDHGNGYYTRYLHLAYGTVKVSVGDKVSKGQVIGYMGNTGYSFGGHLHFEVWQGSSRIDPTSYLENDLPTTSTLNNEVNVFYKVKTEKHGWLPEVKNLEDYAGWEDSPITDVAIRVDKGSIKYRVHNKGGKWLPYVTGYNLNDAINGYAGSGNVIDAIEVYYFTPNDIRPYKKIYYRANGLPWQSDNDKNSKMDGYAGIIGQNITKLEMYIK